MWFAWFPVPKKTVDQRQILDACQILDSRRILEPRQKIIDQRQTLIKSHNPLESTKFLTTPPMYLRTHATYVRTLGDLCYINKK